MIQFLLPPFLITCTLLLALTLAATALAPAIRCKRILVFPLAVIGAGLLFEPLFNQVVPGWQAVAYGERHHDKADEIRNSLIRRYLPEDATDITLLTAGAGHYAHYKISEADFHHFLAGVWDQYRTDYAAEEGPKYWATYSEQQIEAALKGTPVDSFTFPGAVRTLGWTSLGNTVNYPGPRRNSHAGADYWYDKGAGVAFHEAGYW